MPTDTHTFRTNRTETIYKHIEKKRKNVLLFMVFIQENGGIPRPLTPDYNQIS